MALLSTDNHIFIYGHHQGLTQVKFSGNLGCEQLAFYALPL